MTVTAKKKFGQNFLKNDGIQKKFVERTVALLAHYSHIDTIVEVGPGRGDLTQHLLALPHRIVALEIDPEAIEHLEARFVDSAHLSIHHCDALQQLEEISSLAGDNFLFFSNLPFNVGSRILVDMPIIYPSTPLAVVLQKEVIHKLKPAAAFTFFGAWLRLYYTIRFEFDIAPGNFDPAPKVVSTMITARPKPLLSWLETSTQRAQAKKILKALVTYPSKNLTNNLKVLDWSTLQIQDFYAQNQLSPQTRLEWNNYEKILQEITKQ
jgi:16S rRNA (adenine1518-N6/adenine1519-N6)-dimethyltransferase